MMEEQSHVLFRNRQTNSCDCASQEAAFNLEKYGPYIDKIRAFFAPSLEYRIRSLLEEFVYSTDSRLVRRFPCFKKLADTMATWKEHLNKAVEYDIVTMEEAIRNTIKYAVKDTLVACFLDSIILHHRLNRICRELDALGIEDNILRSLNVWNFVNEKDYWIDHSCCCMNPNTAVDCNTNPSAATPCDTRKLAECKKASGPLTINLRCNGSAERVRPMTPQHQRILDSNQDFYQQGGDDTDHFTCDAIAPQNENSCNTECRKIQNSSRLKMIVRKMHLEYCGCSTFSRPIVARLSLPCKPNDLIGRIFEADPSLTESCFIVMKRKFEISMRNVCSCLNDILGRLNVKATRLITDSLYLRCEIRPGYISFKLKTDGTGSVVKCLYVGRAPICQNVRKRWKNAESGMMNDACCSLSDRSFTENTAVNISRGKTEDNNEEETFPCSINEDVLQHDNDFIISSCNKSFEETPETVSDVTLCTDSFEEKNEECCKTSDSMEISCNGDMTGHGKEIVDLNNSIVKNDDIVQLTSNTNCIYSSYENIADTSCEIKNILNNEHLDSLSQAPNVDRCDCTCIPNKDSNHGTADCESNVCSIVSFVQNSEQDKQLVELNCNRFSDNNVATIDKQSDMEDDNSLNSIKAEVGCNLRSFCCHDDFIGDITILDNGHSKEDIFRVSETSQNNSDMEKEATYSCMAKISSKDDNLLTISIQTPRSKVSNGTKTDANCSRTIFWLTSDDNKSISTTLKIHDKCKEAINFPAGVSALPKDRSFRNVNKRICDAYGETRDFIKSSGGKFRANTISRVSTKSYFRTENSITCDTSNTSRCSCSFTTSELATDEKREKFQKFHKPSKFRGRVSSSNSIRSITSVTTIKYRTMPRRCQYDYPSDLRSQTASVTTKFRNLVDRSVDGINRLIRTKLFNRLKATRTSRRNKESFEDTARGKTSGRYIKDRNVSPCTNSDCPKRGYIILHKSSNVIPSNQGKRSSEGGLGFRDRRLLGDSQASSFRVIKTSPWSYDLLILTPDEGQESSKRERRKKEQITSQRNLRNYDKNSRHCDPRNHGRITISSRSTKISLTENDAEYFEHCTCERRKEPRDDTCTCKLIYDRNRWQSDITRYKCQRCDNERRNFCVPIKYTGDISNEISEISSSTWSGKVRNAQLHGVPRKELFPRLENNEIYEGDRDTCNSNNNRLHRRRVFAVLTDTYNDCVDDLDLDFKSKLSRYVELCKNVKRSLMRTLQMDEVLRS